MPQHEVISLLSITEHNSQGTNIMEERERHYLLEEWLILFWTHRATLFAKTAIYQTDQSQSLQIRCYCHHETSSSWANILSPLGMITSRWPCSQLLFASHKANKQWCWWGGFGMAPRCLPFFPFPPSGSSVVKKDTRSQSKPENTARGWIDECRGF